MPPTIPGFFHLPPSSVADAQYYFAPTTGVSLQGFDVWQKPKGTSLVYMFALGGGGGGGGGFSRATGNPGGGGGSGSSSGCSRMIIPAMLLPDTLYIQVGQGGAGGAAGSTGATGLISFILTSKTNAIPNIILQSTNNSAGAGTGGSAGAAGAGGSAGSVALIQLHQRLAGIWATEVGTNGVAGGAQTGAVGTDVTAWAALCLCPGAGGAGSTGADFAGGQVTATALLDIGNQGYYPTGAGNIIKGGTAAGTGVDGGAGVAKITPLYNTGGSGGGSFDAGQGGNGGKGGYGCGGGGGGAGTTGGRGGDGGPGMVIIIAI